MYAMEHLPLGSLAAPARPLGRGEVLRAVAHAAHALHEGGLTHGDLKPANILLTENGAKLSNLGLARYLTPGATLTGMAARRRWSPWARRCCAGSARRGRPRSSPWGRRCTAP